MKISITKIVLYASLAVLTLSVIFAAVSLFPGGSRSYALNSTFTLTQGETYEQGLGVHDGERVAILVDCPANFQVNFTLIKPIATDYVITNIYPTYSTIIKSDFNYTFTAIGSSYEAVFVSDSSTAGVVNFHASVLRPNVPNFPYSWLGQTSKVMFFASLALAMLATLKIVLSNHVSSKNFRMPSISKKQRRYLTLLLLISTVVWFSIITVTKNPLSTFASWYTDNARDSYVSSLFLKDGFSVFSQPLGKLSSLDASHYKFVTWPETPHLYPLGSILLFLPFGVLIQDGFSSLMFKLEIAIFIVFATVGVYFFLKYYFKKDMALILRLFGVYVIYVSLVVYAANGQFDSVAFLFSLFAIFMFLAERYDYFFLLVAISFFFKYQTGIFLFPLILFALIRLFKENGVRKLLANKAVVAGAFFGLMSLFTAILSAPYFMKTTPQLISNGINIFSDNMLIPWSLQAFSILFTLAVTLGYVFYMLNKNSLLSFSALFLLFPSFLLPYFQIWYMPFIFVYALIPRGKNELEATTLWLLFLVVMLAVSGSNYEPVPMIAQYLQGHIPYLPSPLSAPNFIGHWAVGGLA